MYNETKPFVKWAGGKRQLLDKLIAHIPKKFERYYEPFIGGGALLFKIQPPKAVINDNNEQLLNTYRQIKNNNQNIIEQITALDSKPCDKERYLELRKRYNEKILSHQMDVECAALMIWINKHCFNGLYRVNSKGLFNVPYNNKKTGVSVDVKNIINIGKYLTEMDVEIRQGDFEDACDDVKAGDFVYFDSPYVPISNTANFTDYTKTGFSLDDHKRLARLFKKLTDNGVKVMLSNHDVPLVHQLYDGFKMEALNVRRSINSDASKRSGVELIITNY